MHTPHPLQTCVPSTATISGARFFTSSSNQQARCEKPELHWLLSQTSLGSFWQPLLNCYTGRNPRPQMLRPYFEVKDGELRKTLSLVSLTLLSAQLHASRATKIHFINGSLWPTSFVNLLPSPWRSPGRLHTLRVCVGRWLSPYMPYCKSMSVFFTDTIGVGQFVVGTKNVKLNPHSQNASR